MKEDYTLVAAVFLFWALLTFLPPVFRVAVYIELSPESYEKFIEMVEREAP